MKPLSRKGQLSLMNNQPRVDLTLSDTILNLIKFALHNLNFFAELLKVQLESESRRSELPGAGNLDSSRALF